MDYLGLAAAIAFAIFWYKGAEMEGVTPLYWLGPSLVVSGLALFTFTRGWLGVVIGQAALFALITIYRMVRGDQPADD